jgi:Tol biopolymer transport system component
VTRGHDPLIPVVESWLATADAPEDPIGVLDRVVARLGDTPQRRFAWAMGRQPALARTPAMHLLVPVAVAAAIVVTAFLGLRLLLAPSVGGPGPGPDTPPPAIGPAGNGLVVFSRDGDIYIADPATGEATAIVSGPDTDSLPLFSPDGTRIAFLRGADPLFTDASVVVVRADGSDPTVVIPSGYDAYGLNFTWTPDSHAILVNHDFRGGLQSTPVGTSGKLSLVAASGAGEPQILTPPLPYAPGGGYFGNVQVAPMFRPPDGQTVVSATQRSLFLWDLGSQTETPLVPIGLGIDDPVFSPWDLVWSPDGSRIAFSAGDGSEPKWEWLGTFLMNADGSDARRLGDGGSQWSPDGTQMAYQDCRWDPEGDMSGIVIVDVATGAERTLEGTSVFTKTEGTGRPAGYGEPAPGEAVCGWWSTDTGRAWDYEGWSWTPDGRSIVFLETNGERPRMVDVQTGEVTELPWIADSSPSWQRIPLP